MKAPDDDLIAQLQAEIDALPADSPNAGELRDLAAALEAQHEPDLLERIEQQAVHFEAEHTGLAALLRRIADTLGGAGI